MFETIAHFDQNFKLRIDKANLIYDADPWWYLTHMQSI